MADEPTPGYADALAELDSILRELEGSDVDVDHLEISYENASKLFADLTHAGARNALAGRSRGLVGRGRFEAMTAALADDRGKITLELELVYGHCWGAGPKNDPGNYQIDANQIPMRR